MQIVTMPPAAAESFDRPDESQDDQARNQRFQQEDEAVQRLNDILSDCGYTYISLALLHESIRQAGLELRLPD
jgi:hypothetical protein